MYQNKIFCALSSIALIFFCVSFRESLPSVYLIECLILLKTSIQVNFRRDNSIFNELNDHKDTLAPREKLVLIDKSYSVSRFFKFKLILIVGVNILIMLYLGLRTYKPEIIDNFLDEYPYFTALLKERMKTLTLFQNTLYNSLFFLISFPYLSSGFSVFSKVNWKYFRFLYIISFPYKYLQLLQAFLLIAASFMKYTISAYALNFFAFCTLYEISIQKPQFFRALDHPFKHRLLSHMQFIIQYSILLILALEYAGLPAYGLNSFESLLSGLKTAYDGPYLILLAIIYFLSLVIDVFYKVRFVRGQIFVASNLDKNFDQQLINFSTLRERERGRRQSIIVLDVQATNEIKSENFEVESEIEETNENNEIYFTIIRILFAFGQMYTVFIIMRFPYLGFTLSILWLFQSSITRNPESIVNWLYLVYIPTIYYLIRECEDLKVKDQCLIWVLIFNNLIILKFFTHFQEIILSAMKQKQSLDPLQHEPDETLKIVSILWAFILRNSYSITLIIVFWISLFSANLIHTLLLVTTILFIIRHENQKGSNNNLSFRHRNWIWMVIMINIIIIIKYVYMLEMIQFGELGNSIIELFGFQFEYNLPFNLGFNNKDFGSLSIFWMLDFFVVLQYETYKSNTYKQLQQNYQDMITKVKIFSFIRLLYSIFYSKFIIWICYWISILILVFQSFNLINLFQIVILLYTIQMHIKYLIIRKVQYRKIQICWSMFLTLVGVMTLFRYLFDFSCLQLVQNQMRKIAIYDFLFQHQAVIGLSKRVPFLIFPNLVLDIAVLCLGYLGQDYLQQMNSINETKQPPCEIELKELQKLDEPLLNISENDSQIEFRSSLAYHFTYDVMIQFPILKQFCHAINNVMPITIYILTVITSILYKISFSMLIYLLIMFSYIYKTRQYFRDQFQVHKISNKLNEKIIRWKYNFIFKVEKEGIHVRINDDEENQRKKNNSLILQIGMITKDIQQKSSETKQACWHFTIGFSIFFIIITYLSQSLKYFEEVFDQRTMDNIKYILFAFGTYNDYQRKDLIYKDVYPYFMALVIIILDIKITHLMNQIEQESQLQQQQIQQQSSQGNQQQECFNKPFILRRSIENQTNYLIDNFYFNKYQLLKLNFQQCAIHSLERMYMMILFFLGAISEGIFSIIYVLLFALVFYSSKNSKSMINLVSIVVVIFQYICYLITLSQGSSPRYLPEELAESEYLIFNFSNAELLDQLGLSGKGRSKGIFIFNCIIIFAIWLFYYFQEVLSMKIIVFIDQCYINMRIRKKEDHISSKFYIIIKRIYIICIVYFPLFIQLCVLFYYLFITYSQTLLKAINLGMFLFTILYLYLQEIQLKNPKKQTAQRIDIFKSFIIIQQCAILTIFTILFAQKLVDKDLHKSNLSIIEIFIFYLLQLGKDLLESEQYMEISNDFYFNLGNRSEAVGLAMSYEANNRKLMKLIERYKDRNDLKERIDAITEMINQYNSDQNNRQSDINFDQSIDPNNPMSEPLKITIYKWLESHRNRFLFEPSFQIVHFIACQNLEVLQIAEHEIEYITNQDFGSLIFYLENFYREATKFISPTLSKDEFKRKFNQNNKGVQYPQSSEVRMIKKDWQSLKEKISEHSRLNHLRREDITDDNQNIDWKRCLLVIGQFIFTFWHYICFILLITYYFLNHGFFTIILPLLVFAYGSIEEQQPDKTMWVLSFLYLNLLCTLEKIDDIAPFLQRNSFVVFLFGENSVLFQFITIVAIIIQVNIMKNIGIYNKLVNEFETIYGSILRHLFNGTQNPQEGVKRGRMQTIVRSRSQEKFYCISTALQAQRISIQMNQTYVALQRLEDDLIDYLTRIRFIKPSFFLRAFSNMKPGKDIYPFMAGVQIILSIYIFLFYDQMKSMDSPSISELLKYSQFSGHMVIALLFQILCILIDRYIMQYQPKKTEENIIDIFFKGGKKILNTFNDQTIEMEEKKMKQSDQNEISQMEQSQQLEKAMIKSTPVAYQINPIGEPQPVYRKARTLSYNDKKNQIDQKQVEQLALRYKYYFQVFLLLLINLYLLYQIRQSTCNVNGECQYITYNIFMILFYMLICIYFFLSAIQIKYGINDQIAQNTLMKGYKFPNFVIFKIYKLMPFLFELRTICDWAFAETSLTLFQWIKLEELHSLLYLAKCNSYFFSTKKVGQKIPFHTKFSLGFLVIIVLLGLLFGPIFLYSPLNPTFQNDNLIGANIEVGLKINKTNYFTLFVNSHVSDIHQINEFEWNSKNLSQYKFLNNIDKESLQIVKLTHFSDTYWDISYPSLYSLSENLKNVLDKNSDSTFSLVQTYRFQRQYTDLTQQFFSDDYDLNLNKIQQIYNQIVSCQQEQKMLTPIILNKFYHDFIRIDKNKDITVLDETLKNTVSIQLNCTANDQFWWSIYSDYDQSVGMKFYIVSDKYSSALLGYSILGFYITIVYVAGKMARGIMSGGVDMIMLQDMPYPDNLLKICEAIIMARIEKDLVQEELLYFQLIDIIRSPQLMRNISGSFVNQRKKRLEFDMQQQKKK